MGHDVFIVNTCSPEETQYLGKILAQHCYPALTLLLRGDLGSGKTEMTRGFVGWFGYDRVRSPSFSLVHEYPTSPPVVHVDLYRLPERQNLEDLGLEEYLLHGAVVLVEWPEKWKTPPERDLWEVKISFPEGVLVQGFSPETMNHRTMVLKAWGERAQEQLERAMALWPFGRDGGSPLPGAREEKDRSL